MKTRSSLKTYDRYVQASLNNGSSLSEVAQDLSRKGHSKDLVDRVLKPYYREAAVKHSLVALALVVMLGVPLVMLEPTITGLIIDHELKSYTILDGQTYTDYSVDDFTVNRLGLIQSVSISGSLTASDTDTARVYLTDGTNTVLVFNGNVTAVSSNVITGNVIANTSNATTETAEQNETVETNSTEQNQTIEVINTEVESPLQSNIVEENETVTLVDYALTTSLEHNSGTAYDADDNGVATTLDVIDFNVANSNLGTDITDARMCTVWNVHSNEDNTEQEVCYGDADCCADEGLTPSRDDWDDVMFLSYNSLGSTLTNVVSAQIHYTAANGTHYSGDLQSLDANFSSGIQTFNAKCEESCGGLALNASTLQLIVNVSGASLTIDSITYTINQEIRTNDAPNQTQEFGNRTVYFGQPLILNLTNFFADSDGDTLTYTAFDTAGINVAINGAIANISAASTVPNTYYTFFTASDGELLTASNVFSLTTAEQTDELAFNFNDGEQTTLGFFAEVGGERVDLTPTWQADDKDAFGFVFDPATTQTIFENKSSEQAAIRAQQQAQQGGFGAFGAQSAETIDESERIVYVINSTEAYERSATNPFNLERELTGQTTTVVNQIGQTEQRQVKRFITLEDIFNKKSNRISGAAIGFEQQGNAWITEFTNLYDLDPAFIDDTDTNWDAGSFVNMITSGTGVDANVTSAALNTSGSFGSQIFDATIFADWENISVDVPAFYGTELGRAMYDGIDSERGFNTSGLVFLAHLNNDTALGEGYADTDNNSVADASIYNHVCTLAYDTDEAVSYSGASNISIHNGAMLFDGVSEFVSCGTPVQLDLEEDLTACAWYHAEDNAAIISKFGTTGGTYAWRLMTFGLAVSHNGLSGGQTNIFLSRTPNSSWQFICGIHDNSASELRLYLNGYEAVTPVSHSNGISYEPGQVVSIAGRRGASDAGVQLKMNGSIDEISVWNRTLRADEVLELYRRGAMRLNLTYRTCNDPNCDGETWLSPTNNSWYGTKLDISASDNNRYFQYNLTYSNNATNKTEQVNKIIVENVTIEYASVGDNVPNATAKADLEFLDMNNSLNITFNVTDDMELSTCVFASNITDPIEYYNVSVSGTNSECSQNYTIDINVPGVYNISVRVNDSVQQFGQLDYIFNYSVLNNTAIILNATPSAANLTSDNLTFTYNLTGNDRQEDRSRWQWYVNDIPVNGTVGVYANHSFDIAGSGNADPGGMTFAQGFIWIIDRTDDRVYKYTQNGTYTNEFWSTSPSSNPGGITFANDHFWISDTSNENVRQYSSNGTFMGEQWSIFFQLGGSSIESLTFANDHFWVIDHSEHAKVQKFNENGTSVGFNFNISAAGNDDPRDLTFANDHFWVTDFDDLVYVYTENGTYTGRTFNISTEGEIEAHSIAYGNGYFWIGSDTGDEVYQYHAEIINETQTSPGQEIKLELQPFNGVNNGTKVNSTILTIAGGDAAEPTFLDITTLETLDINSSINISLNVSDNIGLSTCIFAANITDPIVYYNVTVSGTQSQCGQNYTVDLNVPGIFNFSVRINDTFPNFAQFDYVLNYSVLNNTAIVLNSTPSTENLTTDNLTFTYNLTSNDRQEDHSRWQWYINDAPVNGTELVYANHSFDTLGAMNGNPRGMAFALGHLWIVDSGDQLIYKYTQNGTYTGESWSTSSSGNANPSGITFANDHFWVTDTTDDEVYQYSENGNFTGTHWDTFDSGSTNPSSLVFANNHFWVTDVNTDIVRQFTDNGTYTGVSFNPAAAGNGQPFGLAFANDHFWINDVLDDLVYKYTTNGTFTGKTLNISTLEEDLDFGIAYGSGYFWLVSETNREVYQYHAEIINETQTSASDQIVLELQPFDGINNGTKANSSVMTLSLPDPFNPQLNASLNETVPLLNYTINLTANVSDLVGLSQCRFIDNQTSVFRYMNKTVSGTGDQCSQNITIDLDYGAIINFTVFVIDTSGKSNQTEFIVAIPEPTVDILTINSTPSILNRTTDRIFFTYNYTGLTRQEDHSKWQYYINDVPVNGTFGTATGTTIDADAAAGAGALKGVTYANNYLYVTDSVDAEVYQFYLNGTATGVSWDTSASGNDFPMGLTYAFDNFWIVDLTDDRVYRYTENGTYLDFFNTSVSGGEDAHDITFANNHFWIVDGANTSVYKFTRNGTYTGDVWFAGNQVDTRGIAFANDYFYVADATNGEIDLYTDNGTFTGTSFNTVGTGLASAVGISYVGGYLWVADQTNDDLYQFYTESIPSNQTVASDNVTIEFQRADSLYNGSKTNISVAINDMHRITEVVLQPLIAHDSQNLNCSFIVTSDISANMTVNVTWFNGSDPFRNVTVNAANATRNWTILNSSNTTVNNFYTCQVVPWSNATGTGDTVNATRFIYGTPSVVNLTLNATPSENNLTTDNITARYTFYNETSIASDHSAWQWYINDVPVNGTLGAYANVSWDTNGVGAIFIGDIMFAKNIIYVLDSNADEVFLFHPNGTYTGTSWDTAASGNNDGQGIAFADGYIWTVDSGDNALYKYTQNGTFTGTTISVQSGTQTGLTFANGFFWIIDRDQDEVFQYHLNGTYTGSSWDTGASGSGDPRGIIFADDHFWTVDGADTLVYKYTSNGTYTGFNFEIGDYGIGSSVGITYANGKFFVGDSTDDEVYVFHAESINSTQTSPGDTIVYELRPFDGSINGTAINSTVLTVYLDQIPSIDSLISLEFLDLNSSINVTVNVTDTNALSSCIFITNATAPLQYFNETIGGLQAQCSQNYTIDTSDIGTYNFTIRVNDTDNNFAQFEYQLNFTLINHTDLILNATPSTQNLTTDNITFIYNITGNPRQEDHSRWQWYLNDQPVNGSIGVYANHSFDTELSGVLRPNGIVYAMGSFWIQDWTTDRVYEFDANGVYTGVNWTTAVEGVDDPRQITFANDHFWLTSLGNDRIYKFTSNGTYTGVSWQGTSGLNGLTFANDHFWTVDGPFSNAYKYTANGTYAGVFFDTAAAGASQPVDIAFADDHFWIVDTQDDRVYKFTEAGEYTGKSIRLGPQGISDPRSLTYHGGNIWVADYATAQVYQYHAEVINGTQTSEGDSIILEFQPNDGVTNGTKVNSTVLTIQDQTLPELNASLNESIDNVIAGSVINISANASDNVALASAQVIENSSGVWRYYNFSISGTNAFFSHNATFLSEGIYNITAVINDTSGQQDFNDTLFTALSAPDTQVPGLRGSINTSIGMIFQNDGINASFNVTDNVNLTNGSIRINQTGVWEYYNFSLNGTSSFMSQNFTITCSEGCIVNVSAIAYDNRSNFAVNDTIFTVTNVADPTDPEINGTLNKSVTDVRTFDVINATFNITDNINATNATVTINMTGIVEYFNFTLNGSGPISQEISQNFSIACGVGCVINVSGLARDNSSNTAINDTVFTVQNTAPAQPTITVPADGLVTNVQPLDINVSLPVDADGDSLTINYYINDSLNTSSAVNTTFNASDGTYKLNISITDGTGHTTNVSRIFTIDTASPDLNVSLNQTVSSITIGDILNLSANTSDVAGLGLVQVIDNATGILRYYNLSTSTVFVSQNITVPSSGTFNLTIFVNDSAGNVEINDTVYSVAALGDTEIPEVNGTLNISTAAIQFNDVVNATFLATDNTNLTNATITINMTGIVEYFNFTLNGSGPITQEFSQNFSIACTAGCVINISGTATDNSSNLAINDTIFTVTASDLIAPRLNATVNTSTPAIGSIVNISANMSDATGIDTCVFATNATATGIYIYLNSTVSGTNAFCSQNFTIDLAQGSVVNISIEVNDSTTDTPGGNVNATDFILTVQNTQPAGFSIEYPTAGLVTATEPVALNVTARDADSDTLTYSFYIDGALNTTSTVNTTFNGSDGTYLLNVSVTDGTATLANQSLNFTVDRTAPEINGTINETLSAVQWRDRINVSGFVSDSVGISTGQVILNDTGFNRIFNTTLDGTSAFFSQNITVACSSGCVINFSVRSNDTANNIGTNDTIVTVTNSLPTLTVLTPSDGLYTNGQPLDINVTNTVDPEGDSLTYNYYINGSVNSSSTGNATVNATDGTYTLNVSISDGSESTANTTISFTIDTVDPNVTITDPSNETVTSATVTVTFNVTDGSNISACRLRVNDLVSATETSITVNAENTISTTLSDGSYNATVNCTDLAGNFNISAATTFTVAVPASGGSSGGGGGGGGGGGSSGGGGGPVAAADPNERSRTWFIIDDDVTWNINNFTVDRFEAEVTEETADGNARIKTSETPFSGTTGLENVYEYLRISQENAEFTGIEIGFRVLNSWFRQVGIEPENLKLSRYDESWQELSASIRDTDNEYTYYDSDVPELGIFAIHGSVPTQTAAPAVEQPAVETPIEQEIEPIQEQPVLIEEDEPVDLLRYYILMLLLVVTLIGSGALGYKRYARRRRSGPTIAAPPKKPTTLDANKPHKQTQRYIETYLKLSTRAGIVKAFLKAGWKKHEILRQITHYQSARKSGLDKLSKHFDDYEQHIQKHIQELEKNLALHAHTYGSSQASVQQMLKLQKREAEQHTKRLERKLSDAAKQTTDPDEKSIAAYETHVEQSKKKLAGSADRRLQLFVAKEKKLAGSLNEGVKKELKQLRKKTTDVVQILEPAPHAHHHVHQLIHNHHPSKVHHHFLAAGYSPAEIKKVLKHYADNLHKHSKDPAHAKEYSKLRKKVTDNKLKQSLIHKMLGVANPSAAYRHHIHHRLHAVHQAVEKHEQSIAKVDVPHKPLPLIQNYLKKYRHIASEKEIKSQLQSQGWTNAVVEKQLELFHQSQKNHHLNHTLAQYADKPHPQVQQYIGKYHRSQSKKSIVKTFVSIGWPKEIMERQFQLYEQKNAMLRLSSAHPHQIHPNKAAQKYIAETIDEHSLGQIQHALYDMGWPKDIVAEQISYYRHHNQKKANTSKSEKKK